MTNKDALIAVLMVSVPGDSIEKALIDASITADDNYVTGNKQKIGECAIEILQGLLSIPDVSEGDLSIKYDRSAVQKRLGMLIEQFTPAVVGVPTIKAVNVW